MTPSSIPRYAELPVIEKTGERHAWTVFGEGDELGTMNFIGPEQVRGGLVDLEFIAQHLQLVHAAAHPDVLSQNTLEAFRNLRRLGLIDAAPAEVLMVFDRDGRGAHLHQPPD